MRTVRISLKAAHWLLSLDESFTWASGDVAFASKVFAELRAAIGPKRSVVASRKRKDSKKKTKRAEATR